jgi:Zn-dependent membrane protease YugP
LVPLANFGSMLSWPLIIIGLLFTSKTGNHMITAGILLFTMVVLFQLVTLPVEINASRRAQNILSETGILGQDELIYTRKVLSAAALTYIASAAAAILQLLRLVILFGGRSSDD